MPSELPLDQRAVEGLAVEVLEKVRAHFIRKPYAKREYALEVLNALAVVAAVVIDGCDGPGGDAEMFFHKALQQQLDDTDGQFGSNG